MSKTNDFLRLDACKDYYCIEVFEKFADQDKITELIRKIEASKSAGEAKEIIESAEKTGDNDYSF
jgi:hypothetical protein